MLIVHVTGGSKLVFYMLSPKKHTSIKFLCCNYSQLKAPLYPIISYLSGVLRLNSVISILPVLRLQDSHTASE